MRVFVDRGSPYSPHTTFHPRVEYKFVVKNVAVKGGTIRRLEFTFSTRKEAEEYLKNFHIGEEVLVYYDPKEPSNCCLIPARLESEAAAHGYVVKPE